MNPQYEIEDFEAHRSIEPLSQRELMLAVSVALMLLLALQAILAGSLVDEPMSNEAWASRALIAGYSVAVAISLLTWVRKLDDERTYLLINFSFAVATVIELALSGYGPGSVGAMFVAYIAGSIFSGQFLSQRAIVFQLVLISICSGIAAAVHYGDPELPYLLARTVAIVPIFWAIAFSVRALQQDRARAILQVEEYAFSDPLTGLVNLRSLRRRGEALLSSRNERINRPTALLIIDLDAFRAANVMRGQLGGDRLLRDVADSMTSVTEPSHTLARTGSDEFMVLIDDADRGELPRIIESYRLAVATASDSADDRHDPMNASIGSAISPDDGRSFDELLMVADRDLYRVKLEHAKSPGGRQVVSTAESIPVLGANSGRESSTVERRGRYSWNSRPMQVRYVTSTWLLTTTTILVSLTMPDAVVDNWGAVLSLSAFAYVLTSVRYFLPPSAKTWQQTVDVLVALGTLALMAYWTGGAGSPAIPSALLILVYVGWFMSLRWIAPMTLVGSIALLLPLTYTDPSDISTMEWVALVGGLAVGFALASIMFYNHFYLERAKDLARQLESIDARTGVYNRREFERRLRIEIDALGYGDIDALAIVMLDLGEFKSVTARIGRSGADRLLTEVGEVLTSASRSEDCVARLGGDEFAVILPGVNADTARALAQRFVHTLTDRIASPDFPSASNVVPSAGFALYGMHGRSYEELITAADIALTAAKTVGRADDRVSSFVVAL